MVLENLIIYLLLIICILVSVAFLTLLEQKLLSYIQIRKGPNKVGVGGILQPFCDAVKLFSKENMVPVYSNYLVYYWSPVVSLILSLMIWLSYPFLVKMVSFELSFMYMLSCMSMGVFPLMISGWSSNSKYSLLGSLRAIAQTISYEVCMIFILLCLIFFISSFNFINFFSYQKYVSFFFCNFMISLVIFIIFLAETNRAPFDFAEGESELVSGFNTEYSGGGFALIFLSEYSMILFFSFIFVLFFFPTSVLWVMFFIKVVFISYAFIWIRGAFPRFRYDKLMNMTWKIYLSFSLNYLFLTIVLKIFLLYINF